MDFKNLNDEVKCIITSLLTSSPLECSIQQLNKDFNETVGYKIPFQKLGYNNIIDYLFSIPDTVRICGNGPNANVVGVIKEKSAHIRELVSKQRIKAPKHRKRFRHNHKRPPRLSNNYTTNWVQKQSNYYHEQLNDITNKTEPTCSTTSGCCSPLELSISSTKLCKSAAFSDSGCNDDSFDIDHNVPVSIQRNFKQLISDFPNGLSCLKLPKEYKQKFNVDIKYDKYGYRSLIEMCLDLPEILICTQPTPDDYILYDSSHPIPEVKGAEVITQEVEENSKISKEPVVLADVSKLNWSLSASLVPTSVLHLSEKVRRVFDFNRIRKDDVFVVVLGEIHDPSKFWIYLKDSRLEDLMYQMQCFFCKTEREYIIPECLLDEGLYCVAIYLGEYNRAVIVDMLPNQPNHVKLFFIDYGTTDIANSQEIFYLPKKFAELPYQSIRAKLSDVFPCVKGACWSLEAKYRFRELTQGEMVASVVKIDQKNFILDILLFDALKNTTYIQDILVDEGFALFVDQEPQQGFSDPNIIPKVEHLFICPDFSEIEQGLAPTVSDMDFIYKNNISVEFYLRPYFDIIIAEENIAQIEAKHEFYLTNPNNDIDLDNVIVDDNKIYLKTDNQVINTGMNAKETENDLMAVTMQEIERDHRKTDDDDSLKPTGSCNRNRIKTLMNSPEDLNNKTIDINQVPTKSPLNYNAAEFNPSNKNLKKLNLNYSNNLATENGTKIFNINLSDQVNLKPSASAVLKPPALSVLKPPASAVLKPSVLVELTTPSKPTFKGFPAPLFQPFNRSNGQRIISYSSEIYHNYIKGFDQFTNVHYKSQFEN